MLISVTPDTPGSPDHQAVSGFASTTVRVVDDPQEWQAFSTPVSAPAVAADPQTGEWSSYISVEGMHCAACALNVEAALLGVAGVSHAEVDAASKRARVQWHAGSVKPSAWFDAVRRAGYDAIPAHDPVGRLQRQSETRLALWQWAVAGFCMMQVMMYAAPEYVYGPGEIPADSLRLLHWAGWVLSLPVLVFSCTPYWKSAWHDLKARRVGMDLPVALGMAIAFAVSSLATFEPGGWWGDTVYFDSFTMFVFFLLTGRWLTLRLRDRTAGALDEVLNRLPEAVQRQTEPGVWEQVSARQLRVGDVIQVNPGERFVADGQLLDADTWVEEALLTGESHPQARRVGEQVLAGSHNLSQQVMVRITQLGADTRHAQIVSLMHDASLDKPRVAQLADRWAKPFLWGVLVAALAAFAYGAAEGWPHAVMAAVSVLIVTCPCALSLATPSALIAAAGRMAREGVLVRKVQALEALSQVDTVVFDKTGTLTTGLSGVERVWSSGLPDTGLAQPQPETAGLQATDRRAWAALAAASNHPVARAVTSWLASSDPQLPHGVTSIREVPGEGLEGEWQSPTGWQRLRLGSLKFCEAWADVQVPESARTATVHVVTEGRWLMSLLLAEQLRPDAQATLEALQAMGLTVHLMSGDRPEQVQRMAQQWGLDERRAHGHCTPQDKLDRLRQLQAQGHRLLMVGDGFNDMPVLAGADVSMAFAQAVPLAQAHADVVALGGRLMAVAQLIALARRTLSVVKGSLIWALTYNLLAIPVAVLGGLPPALAGLGMATSSLWVVLRAMPLNKTPSQTHSV
jgi:Cu2+-exporting ATPase